jgi:uncharacterized phage protein (TIGR02220 family)
MKRFTATEKWHKEWFMELPCRLKCFWTFICESCDPAGIWDPNWKLASMLIGEKVTEKDLAVFGGRIERLDNGKLFIPSFIEFQYGKLSAACKPHTKALASLSKAGIDYTVEQGVMPKARQGQVSESRRKRIYERDGGKCVYCGASDELVPDHIIPCAKGGTDRPSNLVTACVSCNQSKRDRSADEFLSGNPRADEIKGYLDWVRATAPNPTLGRVEEEEKEKEEDKEQDMDKETVPVPPSSPEAELLDHLNKTADRHFRHTPENLKLIRSRLSSVDDDKPGVLKMIDRMAAKWRGDPKMSEFLRPTTLFGKEKFSEYYDLREVPVNGNHHYSEDADEGQLF